MVIKRFQGILGSRKIGGSDRDALPEGDSPEANAGRSVRLFCESGGPNNAEEEVLHLPVIVDATESSPQAAAIAAQQIRKFLSKENYERPHVQYNAIMLIRILADNPGATFTRNIDKNFVACVKELLRNGRDPSVQQLLRETLQALYSEKAYDTNMSNLFTMWGKESGLGAQRPPQNAAWTQLQQSQQRAWNQGGQGHQAAGLPQPAELAARIEEAKTSAKLLQQLVQSTAPGELQSNDLVKEFADRCQTAQRSMQIYINSENPHPDDDTMQTLIETSELLSLAASKHQRALLQARRATVGQRSTPSPRNEPANGPPIQQPSVPTLSQPTLPIRNNQNANAQTSATFVPQSIPTQAMQSTPVGYSPPPVPPPGMRDRLERRISGQGLPQSAPQSQGHSREPSSANSLYSDHQFAPSPESRTTDYDPYRSNSPGGNAPILALPGRGGPPPRVPTSVQPAGLTNNKPLQAMTVPPPGMTIGPVELPSPGYGNPFTDAYHADEEDEEDEDPTDTLYRPPGASARGGTSMKDRVAAALAAAKAGVTTSNTSNLPLPSRPAPQAQESWRGPEGSYYPGYKTTPSYLQRQESAADHLTMRGGNESSEGTPTSPNNRGSEAGVSDVSEGFVRGGRGSVGDVSPIAERRGRGSGGY